MARLWIVMPILFVLVTGATLLTARTRMLRVRRVPPQPVTEPPRTPRGGAA